jgi:type IX secretion system PorP/SprF family membrane protein
MKRIIAILSFCVLVKAHSQQEVQFTQYLENQLYYNPAYAGSNDFLSLNGLYRQQFVGLKGAPTTQSLTMHSPTSFKELGIGLSVLNDQVGMFKQTWFNVDLSYSIRFKKSTLAFGLKTGVNLVSLDFQNAYYHDQGDVSIVGFRNRIMPNIGSGIYYHSEKFFLGLAVPRIPERMALGGEINFIDRRHYYFMAGGIITANSWLKLRPSTMVKHVSGSPLAIDLSMSFIFNDVVWFGLNHRIQESVGLNVQYSISQQLKIGYAYDYSVNKLRTHNLGTHEIFLGYDLNFRNVGIKTPRYF